LSPFDIADKHDLLGKEENQDDSELPVTTKSVEQSKKEVQKSRRSSEEEREIPPKEGRFKLTF
jgi:hypothetical protein